MKRRKLIIAIDGPAGSGKSTTARALAKRLKLPYIDTGAMYRALTLKALRTSVPLDDPGRLGALCRRTRIELKGKDPKRLKVFLDGEDVSRQIRTPELTNQVFYVAREPEVRREMVKKQRAMGLRKGAVMEGRDITTKVFPDADLKLYLDAEVSLRARRRYRELVKAGERTTFSKVLQELRRRDRYDRTRKEGPLRKARGARVIDTTGLTIAQTVDRILKVMRAGRAA